MSGTKEQTVTKHEIELCEHHATDLAERAGIYLRGIKLGQYVAERLVNQPCDKPDLTILHDIANRKQRRRIETKFPDKKFN